MILQLFLLFSLLTSCQTAMDQIQGPCVESVTTAETYAKNEVATICHRRNRPIFDYEIVRVDNCAHYDKAGYTVTINFICK